MERCNGQVANLYTIGLMSYEFKIPAAVPNGKYLLRIEHIGVHNAANYGGAQFFVACGQVEVTGGGSGSPGPLVAIPGEYKADDPGIYFNNYFPAVRLQDFMHLALANVLAAEILRYSWAACLDWLEPTGVSSPKARSSHEW